MRTCFIFFLFISGLLAGCEEVFEKELAGKQITLRAPANNSVSSDTLHTFYWEPLEGAASYQLQVVSPRFDSIARLITDTVISSNRFELELRRTDYQWRVRGINSISSSQYSDTFNLRIQ